MKLLEVNLSTKDLSRFFSKVQVDLTSGCWNWLPKVDADGYGNFRYQGRTERSHRISFAWVNGPIPRPESRKARRAHVPQVDHAVCKNRRCCNPVHLELVTPQVNFLRSGAPNAERSMATCCPLGHPFSIKGQWEKIGQGRTTRRCRICRREQQRRAYLDRKARGYYS